MNDTQYSADFLLDTLPQALFVIDKNAHVLSANQSAHSHFQMTESMMRGRSFALIAGENSPIQILLDETIKKMAPVTAHSFKTGLDIDFFKTADVSILPLDENKQDVLLSLQSRTIPEFESGQEDLLAAALSVSGLAAMLAHEIKNPLSGIRGAAQLLERRVEEEYKKFPRLIYSEVERIKEIVNDLEAFTEPSPPKLEKINIHKILNDVKELSLVGFAENVVFQENYDPSLPFVGGNEDRLKQIFINLIKNASEAIKSQKPEKLNGGTVKISTAYCHDSLQRHGKLLPIEVTVEDNGGGINSKIEDHIFDPFITGKETGAGLGLSLVARFILDLGGTISHENRDDGAIFRVRLPLWRDI